jgi:hypothetical protein
MHCRSSHSSDWDDAYELELTSDERVLVDVLIRAIASPLVAEVVISSVDEASQQWDSLHPLVVRGADIRVYPPSTTIDIFDGVTQSMLSFPIPIVPSTALLWDIPEGFMRLRGALELYCSIIISLIGGEHRCCFLVCPTDVHSIVEKAVKASKREVVRIVDEPSLDAEVRYHVTSRPVRLCVIATLHAASADSSKSTLSIVEKLLISKMDYLQRIILVLSADWFYNSRGVDRWKEDRNEAWGRLSTVLCSPSLGSRLSTVRVQLVCPNPWTCELACCVVIDVGLALLPS